MKQTIGFSQFCDGFRGDRQGQFSYEAKRVLFDWYEELETDCAEDIEFDPVAICCEWCEFDSIEEALENYGDDYTAENLSDFTTVLECEKSVLVMNF